VSLPAAAAIASAFVLFGLSAPACKERAATPAPTPASTPSPATATPAPAVPGTAKVLRADVPRSAPADVDEADLRAVAAGETAFALDLYRQVSNADDLRGKNLFYSPLSIYLAFAMTYAGASGTTAAQMAETFGFAAAEDLHPVLNLLDQRLAGDQNFELAIANSLWGQDGFAFRQGYLEELARSYGAGLRLVDFVDAANREAARLAINGWVEEQTNDRIKDLVPQGTLTELTRLVLANAIYFKADWRFPFSKEATADRSFTLNDGTTVRVPSMYRANMPLRYAALKEYEVVELPYDGTEISMLVLLPRKGEFEALESWLDAATLDGTLGSLLPRTVSVTMPKFEFTVDLALKEHLQAMGMTAPFDPGQADFSGIADPANAPLYIQDALHKAFVRADEEGTEAAAATAIIVGTTSMPVDVVELVIDRPFVFLIRDDATGTVLFAGRVMDPRP
jgi:serpin B